MLLPWLLSLIVVPAALHRRHEVDTTIEAIVFVIRAGCEEQRIGLLIQAAVSELETPEAVDDQRLSIRRFQLSVEMPVLIERVDRAVAEIADEDVIAELPEALRRERDPPGRN